MCIVYTFIYIYVCVLSLMTELVVLCNKSGLYDELLWTAQEDTYREPCFSSLTTNKSIVFFFPHSDHWYNWTPFSL